MHATGVMSIQGQWLAEVAAPLCKFSEPVTEPAPKYSPQQDAVVAWREVPTLPVSQLSSRTRPRNLFAQKRLHCRLTNSPVNLRSAPLLYRVRQSAGAVMATELLRRPQYGDKPLCTQVWFGRHDWDMPPAPQPHPMLAERCAVFAAALLAGQVLPAMALLTQHLAAPPATACQPQGRTQPRVSELLAALISRQARNSMQGILMRG